MVYTLLVSIETTSGLRMILLSMRCNFSFRLQGVFQFDAHEDLG